MSRPLPSFSTPHVTCHVPSVIWQVHVPTARQAERRAAAAGATSFNLTRTHPNSPDLTLISHNLTRSRRRRPSAAWTCSGRRRWERRAGALSTQSPSNLRSSNLRYPPDIHPISHRCPTDLGPRRASRRLTSNSVQRKPPPAKGVDVRYPILSHASPAHYVISRSPVISTAGA